MYETNGAQNAHLLKRCRVTIRLLTSFSSGKMTTGVALKLNPPFRAEHIGSLVSYTYATRVREITYNSLGTTVSTQGETSALCQWPMLT